MTWNMLAAWCRGGSSENEELMPGDTRRGTRLTGAHLSHFGGWVGRDSVTLGVVWGPGVLVR